MAKIFQDLFGPRLLVVQALNIGLWLALAPFLALAPKIPGTRPLVGPAYG
jgi:hypothetical protein